MTVEAPIRCALCDRAIVAGRLRWTAAGLVHCERCVDKHDLYAVATVARTAVRPPTTEG